MEDVQITALEISKSEEITKWIKKLKKKAKKRKKKSFRDNLRVLAILKRSLIKARIILKTERQALAVGEPKQITDSIESQRENTIPDTNTENYGGSEVITLQEANESETNAFTDYDDPGTYYVTNAYEIAHEINFPVLCRVYFPMSYYWQWCEYCTAYFPLGLCQPYAFYY